MLKNVLIFTNVAAGGSASQAHGLSTQSHAVKPDVIQLSAPGFTATANATTVTVTNNGSAPADCDAYVECWHSFERVLSADPLTPQPFVTSPGLAITEAAVRTALAASTGDVSVNGQEITNIGAPGAVDSAARLADCAGAVTEANVRAALAAAAGDVDVNGQEIIDVGAPGVASSASRLSDCAAAQAAAEAYADALAPAWVGIPGAAELWMWGNTSAPIANDTVVVGGHTFKYVGALGAAEAATQILITGALGTDTQHLCNAINGVADVDIVPGTGPAVPAVIATPFDLGGKPYIIMQTATVRGGAAVASSASVVVSQTFNDVTKIWNVGNGGNLNQIGMSATPPRYSIRTITITTAMITNSSVVIPMTFTPSHITWSFVGVDTMGGGGGAMAYAGTDYIEVIGQEVWIYLSGGPADLIDGDMVTLFIFE